MYVRIAYPVRKYGAASFSLYLSFLFFFYLLQPGVDGWWLRLFCLFVVVLLVLMC